MKPAPFAYAKPAAVAEVFDLLTEHGEDARLLAGGQSLIATLNLRLSSPTLLIDINGIGELAGITLANGALRIGAMTRQRALEESGEVRRHAPLLAMAMPHIAHPAIRNRGTIGGSIAFADPAAELPACAVALGAQIEMRGRSGRRIVAAADFFRGLYETDLRTDELVSAVVFPVLQPRYRSAFAELARRHGDYALVGLAAHARLDDGALGDVRLVFFGVGMKPVPAVAAAAMLEGRRADETALADAQAALARDLDPTGDLQAGAATKQHLARVLTGRVLRQLAGEAA